MPNPSRAAVALLILLAVAAAPAAAAGFVLDGREELASERTEAWAMRWFAAALAPTGLGVPAPRPAGEVELGLELGSIPHLSDAQRTVGFNGTKREDLNRSPAYARLRAAVALPAGFGLELGWAPPVEVDGARANLVSLRLGRALVERGRFRLGAALLGATGSIRGDITCDADTVAAGSDPAANPLGCEAVSDDEQRLDSYGVELSAAFGFARAPRLEAHLAAALARLDAEFRVDARYDGLIDRSVLAFEGEQWWLAAGLVQRATDRLRVAAELVYAPLDVVRDPFGRAPAESDPLVNLRLSVAWRLR